MNFLPLIIINYIRQTKSESKIYILYHKGKNVQPLTKIVLK